VRTGITAVQLTKSQSQLGPVVPETDPPEHRYSLSVEAHGSVLSVQGCEKKPTLL
jgi:hypothetical protein